VKYRIHELRFRMYSVDLSETAEADEFLCDLMVDQPNSHTSPIKQRLARSNSFDTPFDWQNLAIKKIAVNVVVLYKTVKPMQVTGAEF